MIIPETTTQTRRERRQAAEAHARHVAKVRAGKAGRKVGVVLGTSGLLLTTTVAAMADEAPVADGRAQSTLAVGTADGAERVSSAAATTVSASADVELAFDRPAVSSDPAAELEPEPEPVTQAQPAAEGQPTAEGQAQPANETYQAQPATSENSDTAEAPADADAQAAGTAEEPAPAASGSVINAAYSAIGTPYVWAGSTLSGMDCSGFINWAYAQAGQPLPGGARSTHGMLASFPQVSTPQPGDIVISTGIRSNYHAGLYVGNGQMVGSLAGTGVTTHGFNDGWHNVVAILRPY